MESIWLSIDLESAFPRDDRRGDLRRSTGALHRSCPVVFVLAALLSARNIPLAAVVLVPLLAAGLPSIPGVDGARRSMPTASP